MMTRKKGTFLFSICTLLAAVSGLQGQFQALQGVWTDRNFQESFAGSYGVLSEREPPIDEATRDFFSERVRQHLPDNIEEAIRLLRERDAGERPHAGVAFTLGNLYFERNDLANAQRYYERAIELFPNFLRAHRNLTFVAVLREDEELARTHAIRATTLGDTDSFLHGTLGELYMKEGKLIAGETALLTALLTDPDNRTWRWLLARNYLEQERWGDAESLMDRLLVEDPEDSDIWLALSHVYIGKDDLNQAATAIEMVSLLGRRDSESLIVSGRVYAERGVTDLAYQAFIAAMDQSPRPSLPQIVAATEDFVDDLAFSEARGMVEKIRSSYGSDRIPRMTDTELRAILGYIAVMEGRGNEVESELREIIAMDPLNGRALLALGIHYGEQGDFQMADFMFERARDLDRFRGRAYLLHGELMIERKRWDDAVEFIRYAVDTLADDRLRRYADQVEEARSAVRTAERD